MTTHRALPASPSAQRHLVPGLLLAVSGMRMDRPARDNPAPMMPGIPENR